VIREDKFVLSKRQYAVDISTLKEGRKPFVNGRGETWYCYSVRAVWFRPRPHLQIAACAGFLVNSTLGPCDSVEDFLARYRDGRYGGDCRARLVRGKYWDCDQDPALGAGRYTLLCGMLDNYPIVPDGYNAWWRFETTKELER